MTRKDIIALIEAVDSTATTIATIAVGSSESAANELVRARRILSGEVYEMNRPIDEMLSAPLARQRSPSAAELRKAYVERNNRARAAIADHQAKWTAMAMRGSTSRYRLDVERIHADQRAYREWLKLEFVPTAAAILKV